MATPTIRSVLFGAGLAMAAPAQESRAAAQTLFEEAFWLETGKGDLAGAAQGYAKAAAAEGNAAVRAKAMLHLAIVRHRCGDQQEAVGILEDLTRRFPDQDEVLREARACLDGWASVDLRQGFTAWYERYRFGPEQQRKVVDLIVELGATVTPEALQAVRQRLLALGDAAVPALQEAAKARSGDLRQRAGALLLELGCCPPARVLLESFDWTEDEAVWRAILTLGEADRGALVAATQNRDDPAGRALHAAAAGADALLAFLRTPAAGELVHDSDRAVTMLAALHAEPAAARHAKIAALARDPAVPLRVRLAAEDSMRNYAWLGADASAWFAWGEHGLTWDTRQTALERATRALRSADGESLDQIFDRLETLPAELLPSAMEGVLRGLDGNDLPLDVPWTVARLGRLLVLATRHNLTSASVLACLRTDRKRLAMLAEAVLLEPEVLVRTLEQHGASIAAYLWQTDAPGNEMMFDAAWSDAVALVAQARWPGWSVAQREAFVTLLEQELVRGATTGPLALWLRARSVDAGEPEALRRRLCDRLPQ